MTYGFGLAGEGVQAFGEGVRQARQEKLDTENAHIERLYKRYELAKDARNRAQEKASWRYLQRVQGAPAGPEDDQVESEYQMAEQYENSILDEMSNVLGGGGKKKQQKGTKAFLQKLFGLQEEYDRTQPPGMGRTMPPRPPGYQQPGGGVTAPPGTIGPPEQNPPTLMRRRAPSAPGEAQPSQQTPGPGQRYQLPGSVASTLQGAEPRIATGQDFKLPTPSAATEAQTLAMPHRPRAVGRSGEVPQLQHYTPALTQQEMGVGTPAAGLPTPKVAGQLEPGNIDLARQPKVRNADGSVSTVDSSSYNLDGQEVLLPSVTPDGRHLVKPDGTPDHTAIIREYQKTGRHLGKFRTPEEATAYAQKLHEDYAAGRYEGGEPSPGGAPAPAPGGAAVPAGQPYSWGGGKAEAEVDKVQELSRRSNILPSRVPMAPDTLKRASQYQNEEIERHVGTIMQNLSGYVQHVLRTPDTEDDSLSAARKDPVFAKHINLLEELQAKKMIPPTTVDTFLRRHWPQEYSGRASATRPPTREADVWKWALREAGGDVGKAQEIYARKTSRPTGGTRLTEVWDALKKKHNGDVLKAQEEFNKTNPGYSIITGSDPDTGDPTIAIVARAPGATAQQVPGIKPKVEAGPPASEIEEVREIQTEDPRFPGTGLQTTKKVRVASARRIIQYYERNKARLGVSFLQRMAKPEIFTENPEDLKILKDYIRNMHPGSGVAQFPESPIEFEEGPAPEPGSRFSVPPRPFAPSGR